jgi:hypothetical protein
MVKVGEPAAIEEPDAGRDPELADHESLYHAIEGFVRANCNFESSVPINTAVEELGRCAGLQEAFAIPLQRQLFNMDAALRWVLFLAVAPRRAEEDGDAPFAPGSFSCEEALGLISQVYDMGTQDSIWDHFESDEDDDDDDDEEEAAEDA